MERRHRRLGHQRHSRHRPETSARDASRDGFSQHTPGSPPPSIDPAVAYLNRTASHPRKEMRHDVVHVLQSLCCPDVHEALANLC